MDIALLKQWRGAHVKQKRCTLTDPIPAKALLALTANIVSAYAGNNNVLITELPNLIRSVHGVLAGLRAAVRSELDLHKAPAVSVPKSIQPTYLVCLEDGKKFKTLKRHLMTHFQMTPADYRIKWNLPMDYPMTAPEYSRRRRALAKKIGLGRKREIAPDDGANAPQLSAGTVRRKLGIKLTR